MLDHFEQSQIAFFKALVGAIGDGPVDVVKVGGVFTCVGACGGACVGGGACGGVVKLTKRAIEQCDFGPSVSVEVEVMGQGGSLFVNLGEKYADWSEWLVQRFPFSPVVAARRWRGLGDAVPDVLCVGAVVSVGYVSAQIFTRDPVDFGPFGGDPP